MERISVKDALVGAARRGFTRVDWKDFHAALKSMTVKELEVVHRHEEKILSHVARVLWLKKRATKSG